MKEINVAQIVLRTESEDGYRYFIGRRRCGGYYEWIGGKREEGESIEEAAERELKGDTDRLGEPLLQHRGKGRALPE